jgi:hypothetical protein
VTAVAERWIRFHDAVEMIARHFNVSRAEAEKRLWEHRPPVKTEVDQEFAARLEEAYEQSKRLRKPDPKPGFEALGESAARGAMAAALLEYPLIWEPDLLDWFAQEAATAARRHVGGRPGDNKRILAEAERRIKAGQVPHSLREFARQLRAWLEKQPDAKRARNTGKVMQIRAIEKCVGPLWHRHTQGKN